MKNECDCGTKNEALVWCYIHGYKIKPPVVKRARAKTTVVQQQISAKTAPVESTT